MITLVYEAGIDTDIIHGLSQQIHFHRRYSQDEFSALAIKAGATGLVLKIVSHPRHAYRLELACSENPRQLVRVDFDSGSLAYRLHRSNNIKQALARAVGLKHGRRPAVIDATAGMGRDGFLLASLGCKVTFIERSPIIHALLKDGLRRVSLDGKHLAALQNIDLHLQDSCEYLTNCSANELDVVYLDPMYPDRSKSALVKKEMRILRQVVGKDADVSSLFTTALRSGAKRIVVKRPGRAETLCLSKPSFSINGKTTRYDVYLNDQKAAFLQR